MEHNKDRGTSVGFTNLDAISYGKWKVILLKNTNVVFEERYGNWIRCFFMGIVWKYIPDLTFKNRDFLIVDNPFFKNKKSI